MSKITLGKPPKTFAPVVVSFTMPDKSEGSIECVFKYRTRKQFGEFLAGTFGDKSQEGKELDFAALIAQAVDKNGAYMIDVLDSWSLDEKLTAETAAQLADEVPAAAAAIMAAYSAAVTEGRLGN
jgi:hypothetical protein